MKEFDYLDYLNGAGVEEGDILDVTSDMFSMALFCRENNLIFDMNHLLDSLKDIVGFDGTIMIRSFTWDFCKGVDFDIRYSKSHVGVLGDVALKRTDFKRSKHPIYSWVIWGKYKDEICSLENINGVGEGSPFDFLSTHDGKQLRIGNVDSHGFTQLHHAEKLVDVPFRYEKYFDGNYIDCNGKKTRRRYTFFVRRLDIYCEVYSEYFDNDVEKEWEKSGIQINKMYHDELCCTTVKLREAENWMVDDFNNNYGRKLYIIEDSPGYKGLERLDNYQNQYRRKITREDNHWILL